MTAIILRSRIFYPVLDFCAPAVAAKNELVKNEADVIRAL